MQDRVYSLPLLALQALVILKNIKSNQLNSANSEREPKCNASLSRCRIYYANVYRD